MLLFKKQGYSYANILTKALKPAGSPTHCSAMKTSSTPSPDALLAFDALARKGSFTAAADDIGCAKSRISQLVKELEQGLGTVLVLRNTRRVALTETGRRLAEHARQLREMLEQVGPDIEQAQGLIEGPLRISATASFAQYLLAPMLSELAACHPDLELELRAENRLQDPINDGVDFCIRSRNVHDDRLVAKPLGFVWEAPYASPDYLAKAPPLNSPDDLCRHRILLNSHHVYGREWRLEKDGELKSITTRPMLVCDQYASLISGLIAGHGVALLPHYVASHYLDSGHLVRVLPGWQGGSWPVYLVFPYRQPLPKKYEAFIQHVTPRLRAVLEERPLYSGEKP